MITEQDYNDLRALAGSAGWQLVRQYVENQIRLCLKDLENKSFADLSEVALLQGKIQAFRTALEYPGTRIREYEAKNFKTGG